MILSSATNAFAENFDVLSLKFLRETVFLLTLFTTSGSYEFKTDVILVLLIGS